MSNTCYISAANHSCYDVVESVSLGFPRIRLRSRSKEVGQKSRMTTCNMGKSIAFAKSWDTSGTTPMIQRGKSRKENKYTGRAHHPECTETSIFK